MKETDSISTASAKEQTTEQPAAVFTDGEVQPTDGAATSSAESSEEVAETCCETDKLAEAELQVEELKDQLLRRAAEFENFRKRTIKEKTELILGGGRKVIESLLPVLDDLDRAKENIECAQDISALKEGVGLIMGKLWKTLSEQGLARIDTAGASFDTDFHEAVTQFPVDDDNLRGKVIDCVQAGYTLSGKVIRHAKVVVGA